MKSSVKKVIFRFFKITGIALGILLLLIIMLPYLFPTAVSNEIKKLANANLKGELNFSKARLSFLNHFPSLTVTLYDFSLKGSAPFQNDTLLACNELAFGLDVTSLFKSRTNINKIILTNAFINIQVDSTGRPNYNVYVSKKEKQAQKDSSTTSLRIEEIVIEKSRLVYNDQSLPMLINATGFNYNGKGDLSKDVFDLQTQMQIDSLDFIYGGTTYVKSKKFDADLITQINTNSLELVFAKNNLKINQLPVQFIGRFAFLDNGYDLDFKIDSKETGLYNIVTALPPAYLKWTDHVALDGKANIYAELLGKYISATNQKPNFKMNVGIRNGSVDYEKATTPATNLFLDFNLKLPNLNTDSLHVDVDSLAFNVDKAFFKAELHTTGLDKLYVFAKINTDDMDLQRMDEAFGFKKFHVKGNYSLHLLADGIYATKAVKNGKDKMDTVIASIPTFNITSTLENGFFKLDSLQEGINNISFKLNAFCPDNNYKNVQLAFENINAQVLNNYIKGFLKLDAKNDINLDANLQTKLNLAEIKKFYPLDSLDLKGNADINVVAKGKYNAAKKLFPVTNAYIKMDDGSITTKYYPEAIKKITVDATITNTKGNLGSTSVFIKPISFEFAGQPFMISAGLKNFNDITYNIYSKGRIDLGKIYKVFAYDGLDVKGYLETNVSLKGSQQDAIAGRYDRLFNKGQIKVRNMVVKSIYFPKPFLINTGVFSFKQDKMWFDQFQATYGKSDFALNGYLSNVINYAIKDQPLTGNFELKSNKLIVDEFMAFAGFTTATTQSSSKTASGVVMIPENLDMTFTADVNKILYSGLTLDSAKGQMQLQKGTMILKQTGFTLINAPVVMDLTYKNLSPISATFDYHLVASNFNIQKAYKEIKIFHDMATAAASAEGVVSLDYALKGKLNGAMMPIYPSLVGGGILSIKQVKMKGFKLMDALSKGTGKDDIKNPDLSKIDIKTKITNNIMTLERVKLKVAGFRPRFEGQVSLDGRLDLTGRLGLPPFGIFGIPFTVTGTQENPQLHFRRNRETDKLEETAEPAEDERPKVDSSKIVVPKQ